MPNQPLPNFAINVGPGGTFKNSGNFQTFPQDVDEIFEKLSAPNQQSILFYFHGGLVNETNGMRTAERLSELFEQDNITVVSVVWETGIFEIIKNRLSDISQTELFKKLFEIAKKELEKRLGIHDDQGSRGDADTLELEANGELPNYLEADIEASIEEEIEIDEDELQHLLEEEAPETPEFDQKYLSPEEKSKDARGFSFVLLKPLLAVIYRVIKRYIKKRDHGFFPSIVEELLREFYLADFGQWVWGNIKSKANEMWSSNHGLAEEKFFAGRYLLEKLSDFQTVHPNKKIHLIGHSAGSIAICEMVKTAHQANLTLTFRNMAFLAPACTFDLFKESIIERENIFQNFYLFNMLDEVEQKDPLVPVLYKRSLLYLVSGAFERNQAGKEEVDKPLMGMHRFFSGESPFNDDLSRHILDFMDRDDVHAIYSVTPDNAEAGRRSSAAKHGDFDDDEETLESLKTIIQNS
ncbi:MAG: alpha/beta hydrolase [Bacteroidetes bacterium]|nr:MAG: alpha/beta hydrolase [Bacteroidota bacterium]